jgi:hypothetical protein
MGHAPCRFLCPENRFTVPAQGSFMVYLLSMGI